jgi:D-3-phosphoglycerate dehydrogenase / 2-oxoglutarate reductase
MDPVEPLILDLLDELRGAPQPVRDVLDRWRTSCPRLPVWEEAQARGLIVRRPSLDGSGQEVLLSESGRALLDSARVRRSASA